MTDPARHAALMERIYAAAGDAPGFAPVLAALSEAVGGAAAALFFSDQHNPDAGMVDFCSANLSEQQVSAYADYYIRREVRFAPAALLPVGAVYLDDRHMAFRDVERTEIYADYYRKLGLGHCAGITLFRERSRTATLAIHRPAGAGTFADPAIDLLADLAPHLVRALQLRRQLAAAEARAAGLTRALDHFAMAVFVVDAEGRVRDRNAAAEALLAQPDCPLRLAAGRLHAPGTTLASLYSGGRPKPVLRLPRPAGGGHLHVMAAPATEAAGDDPGLTLLFVNDVDRPARLHQPMLRDQLALSRSEAAVAAALCAGHEPPAIAAARGVSLHTVRTQIKAVYAKLGAHSHARLTTLLGASLAALLAPDR